MKKFDLRLWTARLLITIVLGWNLECALAFLLNPGAYTPGFELTGIPGNAAIRGFAVLFGMWCVPYGVALWHPQHQRVSLWEALVMQTVGVVGESLILISLPAGYPALQGSLIRFITFDALGIFLLVGAVLLLPKVNLPPSR